MLVCDGHDNSIRWRDGERLHHLFETRCDRLVREGKPDHLAVDAEGVRLTYVELDERANQLARHLAQQGARAGDRIGLLFDGSEQMYVSMLAVLKLHAAYVPLDAGFPADRLAFIARDAAVSMLVTMSHLRGCLESVEVATVCCVDEEAAAIDRHERHRLAAEEIGETDSDLAYIIYTSGSTGRPKGVAIEHPRSATSFASPCEVYGIFSDRSRLPGDDDRVRLLGRGDLGAAAARARRWSPPAGAEPRRKGPLRLPGRATASRPCAASRPCSPRSTKTCPACGSCSCRARPARTTSSSAGTAPDVRFLNVYGPTEAAVTATWTRLLPDEPVTIGVPAAHLLDRRSRRGRTGRVAARRGRRDRHRRHLPVDAATSTATTSPNARSSLTSSALRTTRRAGSTAPATSGGSTNRARSSTSGASTPR